MIFLDAVKSIDTGFVWKSFTGTELRYFHHFSFEKILLIFFLSYMNENNDIWVNGEDLKYEYAYFSVNAITGKKP